MSYLGPTLRRRRRTLRAWPRLALALAASLALNAALLLAVRFGIAHAPQAAPQRSVAMAPLSAEAWSANRAVKDSSAADPQQRAAQILAELAREPPPPASPAQGQVVEVAPSKDSTPPKDSRFVSDRDNRVDKETISRNRKAGFARTAPAPTDPGATAKPPAESGAEAVERKAAAAAKGGRGAATGSSTPARSRREEAARADQRLALKLDQFGEMVPRQEKKDERPPPSAVPRGDPSAPDQGGSGAARPGAEGQRGRPGAIDRSKLAPSAATYDRLAGGPAPDHVTGVEEGEGTFLNTREWKYASYFNRIKQAVANTWDPNRVLTLRDPDGRRFAYRDRHTLVSVRLDESGSLRDVEVVKSCGVDFLDQVALEAFKKAQPFVNPPRGLADPRGEIAFTFGFYLETGGGFRMYRQQQ